MERMVVSMTLQEEVLLQRTKTNIVSSTLSNFSEDHFRKTFITTQQELAETTPTFSLHDIMIPAGRTAKLV